MSIVSVVHKRICREFANGAACLPGAWMEMSALAACRYELEARLPKSQDEVGQSELAQRH